MGEVKGVGLGGGVWGWGQEGGEGLGLKGGGRGWVKV